MGRCIPPPPRAMGCNRNRPDINTTTVGGRGGGLGGCVYRLSLPRHGGPEGGGRGWEMDIRDPPVGASQFSTTPAIPVPVLPAVATAMAAVGGAAAGTAGAPGRKVLCPRGLDPVHGVQYRAQV